MRVVSKAGGLTAILCVLCLAAWAGSPSDAAAGTVSKQNNAQQNRFKTFKTFNRGSNSGGSRSSSRQSAGHSAAKQQLFKPRQNASSGNSGGNKFQAKSHSASGSGGMRHSSGNHAAGGSHKGTGQSAAKGNAGNIQGQKSNKNAVANQFKQFQQLKSQGQPKVVNGSPPRQPFVPKGLPAKPKAVGGLAKPAGGAIGAGAAAKQLGAAKPLQASPSAAAQKLVALRQQRIQALRQLQQHRRNQAAGNVPVGLQKNTGLQPNSGAAAKNLRPAQTNANSPAVGFAAAGGKNSPVNIAAKFQPKGAVAGPLVKSISGAGGATKPVLALGPKTANGAYKASPILQRKWNGLASSAKPYLPPPLTMNGKGYNVSPTSNPQLYKTFSSFMLGISKLWVPYYNGNSPGVLFIVKTGPYGFTTTYKPWASGGSYSSDAYYWLDGDNSGDDVEPIYSGTGGGGPKGGNVGSGGYPSSFDPPDSPPPGGGPSPGPGVSPADGMGGGTAPGGGETASADPSPSDTAADTSAADTTAGDTAADTGNGEQQEAAQQENGATPSLATLGGLGGARYDACTTLPEKDAAKPKPAGDEAADDAAPISPQLVLDTGGHTAQIRALVFTPSGNCLISGGDDKTIRIWSLGEGRSERVLRGEIDTGAKGTVHALALSPDGVLLAAAGSMDAPEQGGHAIRVYDLRTGEIAFLLVGHSDEVRALAFSPDGDHLLSGSMDKTAVLWDMTRREPMQVFRGHDAGIISVAFTSDGLRAVTASLDKTARLWSPASEEALETLAGHEAPLTAMTVLPGRGSIATASQDGAIKLWSSSDGKLEKDVAKVGFVPGALVPDAEGGRLVVTCAERCKRQFEQHVLSVEDGGVKLTYKGHDGFVLPAAFIDGVVATGGGLDHEIHLWKLDDGQVIETLKGTGRTVSATGFYPDNRTIAWSHTFEGASQLVRGPMQMSIDLPTDELRLGQPLTVDADSAKEFVHSEDRAGDWNISVSSGSGSGGRSQGKTGPGSGGGSGASAGASALEIRENGDIRSLLKPAAGGGERLAWRTYGFAPSGEVVLGGGDKGLLEAYDLEGNKLASYVGHAGTVWTQTPSPDGRLMVSGGGDQTVKLWNLATGELVVTLFDGADGEWVMWTPQGYYTGSEGGGELVGWHVNRGADKAAEYVRGQQLREQLNRPDIVERAILSVSAKEAVEKLAAQGMTVEKILGLGRPPVVALLQSDPDASGGRATIVVGIRESNLPIDSVDVWVKDRKVAAEPGELPADLVRQPGIDYRALVIPLFGGENVIRVVATNEIGSSDQTEKALSIKINHRGEGALDKRGTLFILAVGVDKYPGLPKRCLGPGGSCDLQFAGSDARGFTAIAEREMKRSHDKVVVRLLTNLGPEGEAPTKANIKSALDGVAGQAKGNDTVALFFAGHGVNRGGSYYFVPTDAVEAKGENGSETFIEWGDVQSSINRLQGRRLLFLDACHAGNSYDPRVKEDAKVSRFVLFAAASGDQFAEETAEMKHGHFTFALMNGLGGEAEDKSAKAVLVYDLASYISKQVMRATKGRQTPEFYTTPGDGNFALVKR